jgi:hypothetical protein
MQALQNTRHLATPIIRTEQDSSPKGGRARKKIIPYLEEVKRSGHRALLRSISFQCTLI